MFSTDKPILNTSALFSKKEGFPPQDISPNEEKGFQESFVKAVKIRIYYIDKFVKKVTQPVKKPCPVL